MKLLTSIIAIIGLIITIAFTIFPIGNLTVFPAIITALCGIILFKIYTKEGSNQLFPKLIIGLAVIGAVISICRAVLVTDTVAEDQNFELRQEQSNEDAVKELEELE
ncbi:MAG: hypothetical protein ACPGU9_00545 [Flavobacteriaceae bacterium]